MVAVTLSSSSIASRAALARPKALKRNSRVALRVRAKLETEDDTAEKTDAPTTEPGFLSGLNNVIKSIWPGSDVANAFTAPKVNPAAEHFDANTMSEAERNALKRQYAQPTFLDGLFPKREPHDGLEGIGGNELEHPEDPSSAQAATPFHNSTWNLNPAAKLGVPFGDDERNALRKQYDNARKRENGSFLDDMFPKREPHDHE